jgi:hypothetical protein
LFPPILPKVLEPGDNPFGIFFAMPDMYENEQYRDGNTATIATVTDSLFITP